MNRSLIIFCVILLAGKIAAQELVSSASTNFYHSGYYVTFSIGEPIIGNSAHSNLYVHTGVQQPLNENLFGQPSLIYSRITANPGQILADAISTANLKIELRDKDDEIIPWGGEIVEVFSTLGEVGTVTDQSNGNYLSKLTSSLVPCMSTILFEINGYPAKNTAVVDFLAKCENLETDITTSSSNLSSQLLIARKTITSAGKIGNGQEVVWVSGQTITLKPGFTVSPGGLFTANVCNMLHCEASAKHQHLINNEEESPEHFMIFPNPTSEEARIELNIPFESHVNIYLTNPLGQVVNKYESRKMLGRGMHYQDLNLRGLKAGVYTIRVVTGGWMESKNLVLIKN